MGDQIAINPEVVVKPPEYRVYRDTLLQGSSRLHAGDVYGNVVNSTLAQDLMWCSYPAILVEC